MEQGPFLANPHVILARSGPEINPPTPVEQGPFLASSHVILARSRPEINPPTPQDSLSGRGPEARYDKENPRPEALTGKNAPNGYVLKHPGLRPGRQIRPEAKSAPNGYVLKHFEHRNTVNYEG